MAITTEVVSLEENRVRLEVAVPKDDVDRKIERTLKRLGRDLRVPGFRPGKAPTQVVLQRFGHEAVVEETLRDSLGEWYGAALTESGVQPVSDPEIDFEESPGESGFAFTATVHTRPTAKLGEYTGLEVAKGTPEVPENGVEEEIDRLRGMAARLQDVERPAQTGDFVTIDFDGTVDGEALSSASARDYLVEVADGTQLRVVTPASDAVAAGSNVWLHLQHESCRALSA